MVLSGNRHHQGWESSSVKKGMLPQQAASFVKVAEQYLSSNWNSICVFLALEQQPHKTILNNALMLGIHDLVRPLKFRCWRLRQDNTSQTLLIKKTKKKDKPASDHGMLCRITGNYQTSEKFGFFHNRKFKDRVKNSNISNSVSRKKNHTSC